MIQFASTFDNGLTNQNPPILANTWADAQFALGGCTLSDVAGLGKTALQVVVRPGDVNSGGERAELVHMTEAGAYLDEDENSGTKYYGISVLLPLDWTPPQVSGGNQWGIVLQCHGPNNYISSPAVALDVTDKYRIDSQAGDNDKVTTNLLMDLSDPSLNLGKRTDWIIKVIWDKVAGEIQVWRRNGTSLPWVMVLDRLNIPTLQYQTSVNGGTPPPHYWKTGFYRSTSPLVTNTLYLDYQSRGDSFNEVEAAFGDNMTTINLTGISGGYPGNPVTVAAAVDQPALLTVAINYISPGTTGTLSLSPTAGAEGSANVTVTVKDTTLKTTTAQVLAVTLKKSKPPTIDPIQPVTIYT